jgi:tetratricopeptide (TPR) repeat protein
LPRKPRGALERNKQAVQYTGAFAIRPGTFASLSPFVHGPTPIIDMDTPFTPTHAVHADPLNPDLHRSMASALRAAGDETGALAHEVGIETFAALAGAARDEPALALFNIATVYYMKGDYPRAQRWYEITLSIDPDLAMAHQNLAAVFDATGRAADALAHRTRAYTLQRVFPEPAEHPARRVLILFAGRASGNVPIDTLLPSDKIYRIKYAIDCAGDVEDFTLPSYDLVFNAIGEADIAEPLTPRLQRFALICGRPLLNDPAAVMRTQRHRLPELLAGIEDVLVAPCIRLDALPDSAAALADDLAQQAIGFPLLSRAPGKHGGESLTLHASADELWAALQTSGVPAYLTMFRDFRSPDGHFRKYRTVFVDREPFAYHLAISSHWLVHYFSADMLRDAWKIEEERRFLEDTQAALGERATRALEKIAQRLALDYAGIDFTLLPDGRLLAFEANATMLVHREAPDGPLAHKNHHVQRIADAFERMQVARVAARAASGVTAR